MSCIKFRAYDKRVKEINYLNHDNSQILTTVSTEGYISIWSIEELVSQMEKLDHKLLDLGEDEFKSVYNFQISSRIISCSSRLNFVHGTRVDPPKPKTVIKKNIKKVNRPISGKLSKPFSVQNRLRKLRKFKNLV